MGYSIETLNHHSFSSEYRLLGDMTEFTSNIKKYKLEYWIDPNQYSKESLKKHVEEKLGEKLTSKIHTKILAKEKHLVLIVTSREENIDACHGKLEFKKGSCLLAKDELGDYLRSKLYPILARIEIIFRRFINQKMMSHIGFDWWDSHASQDLREKVKLFERRKESWMVSLSHPLDLMSFDYLIDFFLKKNLQRWSAEKTVTVNDLIELISTCGSFE